MPSTGPRVKPVLTRPMVRGTPLEGYVGFGTPRIVLHPDTREPYMVFTAWRDPQGLEREVWVTPTNRDLDLDLRSARRIATGADAGVKGLNTVDLVWDDGNEEWLIFSTRYPVDRFATVVRTDRDFVVKGIELLELHTDPGDGGFPCIVANNGKALCSAGLGRKELALLEGVSQRPLKKPRGLGFNAVSLHGVRDIDVHKLFTVNGSLYMLAELRQGTNTWSVRLFIGPESGWYDAGGRFLLPVSLRSPIPASYDYEVGNVGHPEYASQLSEPALLWASFRCWNLGGPRAWGHEIWAVFVGRDTFADSRDWLPAVMEGDAGMVGIPFFTAGARRAVVHVCTTRGARLRIVMGYDVAALSQGLGDDVEEHYVRPGTHRIVVEDPLPYMALSGGGVERWSVYLAP